MGYRIAVCVSSINGYNFFYFIIAQIQQYLQAVVIRFVAISQEVCYTANWAVPRNGRRLPLLECNSKNSQFDFADCKRGGILWEIHKGEGLLC